MLNLKAKEEKILPVIWCHHADGVIRIKGAGTGDSS